MNRFNRRPLQASLLDDHDDEERLFEREALIDDNRYDSSNSDNDDNNQKDTTSIRKRQSANQNNLISTANHSPDKNLRTLKKLTSNDNLDNSGHIELKRVNGDSKLRGSSADRSTEYVYYDVKPGDSLHSICLRYACSVTHVKRLNGLMTDQEFYGLRQIKLPLGKLGLLEDFLKSESDNSDGNRQSRWVNPLPGTATPCNGSSTSPHYRVYMNPGQSSDNISGIGKITSSANYDPNSNRYYTATRAGHHGHSQSFSSLRDLQNSYETNIDMNHNNSRLDVASNENHLVVRTSEPSQFIKPEMRFESLLDSDDIMTARQDCVDKVFKNLDEHVEKAKKATDDYDQRASELVDKMAAIGPVSDHDDIVCRGVSINQYGRQAKVSKIPQLFSCNENFGMNYGKLIAFILIVCLTIPLVYVVTIMSSQPGNHNQSAPTSNQIVMSPKMGAMQAFVSADKGAPMTHEAVVGHHNSNKSL